LALVVLLLPASTFARMVEPRAELGAAEKSTIALFK
jgi:hypothetical protein